MHEREAMQRALDLAWRGWGRVSPNPLVGAVVLADGEPVGEGWHAEYGGPHAEAVALAEAGARARGATLVVTLEPCAHVGKQPACVDAVVRAGIRRVVVALADPTPLAGGGAEQLRAAGIDVELGLCAAAAAAQNAAFLYQATDPTRPFVALKLATSLDGRIADPAGNSRWISGTEARDYVQWLRAGFDAIGVGGATARRDDSSLTVRGSVQPRVAPRRVVFDPRGLLPPDATLARTARDTPTVLVAAPGTPADRLAPLREAGVAVVATVGLRDALEALRREGVGSLLVEGGGRLAGALLGDGLVDRYYWIQSPLWLGDSAVVGIAGLPGSPLEAVERWHVVERRALGDDTLLVLDRKPCSPAS